MSPTVFEAGAGTAFVAPHTVVLADPSDTAQAERLAMLVDIAASIDELLAAGPDDLAIAWLDTGAAEVVARGAAEIDVLGSTGRRIDGADDAPPCRIGGAEHVTMRLTAARGNDARSFSVLEGVVPAVAVHRRLVAEPPAATEIGAGNHADAGHDVDPGAPDPFDAMFGHTVVRSVEAAAVRPGGPPAAGRVAGPDPRPVGVLVFSTGERVVVDRPLVLGRNPHAEPDAARPVKVAGAGVSRRHAAITVDRWCAEIDDLGSANGTEVTLPGGAPCRLAPGRPVGLVAGTRVDLAGEVSFVVEDVA